MTVSRILTAAFGTFLFAGGAAQAAEFEQYCNRDGFAVPVRQTLVVLDEQHVFPEPGKAQEPRNASWRRFVGNLVPAETSALEQSFLPRERVTILIARKDGAGMRSLFTGCLPFFSVEELAAIAKEAGYKNAIYNFFGASPRDNAKKDMERFRIRIGEGLQEALQPAALSAASVGGTADIAASGLVSSLKQGNFINLNYGIPRIVLYSDMTRFFGNAERGAKGRQMGLDKGLAANLNLKGAEVYVAGMSGGAGARDALEMFFLGARAELVSTGAASSLPSFAPNATQVRRFQGTVQWISARLPIRIRLATDRNGTVVNSWIFVNTEIEQFNPFHGVVTCASETSCKFTGDETFAQVWNPDRANAGTAALNADMPFGGARTLEFAIENGVARGAIFDHNADFKGAKNNRLEFTANRQAAASF